VEEAMKKSVILAFVLVIGLAGLASAQTPAPVAAAAKQAVGPNFVDANGDGICDLFQSGVRAGKGYGRGDGTGTGIGPRDGSGLGRGPQGGGGVCDGTGPKGQGGPARGQGRGARR
jgi:hypothetical protein